MVTGRTLLGKTGTKKMRLWVPVCETVSWALAGPMVVKGKRISDERYGRVKFIAHHFTGQEMAKERNNPP